MHLNHFYQGELIVRCSWGKTKQMSCQIYTELTAQGEEVLQEVKIDHLCFHLMWCSCGC